MTNPKLLFRAEHLNSPVLTEVMVEGEGPPDVAGLENGERNRVAQSPILVGVSSYQLSSALLFGGQRANDRQSARQQPLSSDHSPELPHEERVRFRFDVVGDEARARFGRNVTRHRHSTCVIGIVGIEQSENGA